MNPLESRSVLRRLGLILVTGAALAISVAAQTQEPTGDPVLDAMSAEMDRARALKIVNLDSPYFIQYRLDDARMFSVNASLGAVIDETRRQLRMPSVEVRVGDYSFDNSNYVYTDLFNQNATRGIPMPLDDNELALRTFFWLATDRGYKGAVEAIARKRSALEGVNVNEALPDFWPAEPERLILDKSSETVDESQWIDRIRELSSVFTEHPDVLDSEVVFSTVISTAYLANSEGTMVRQPDDLVYVRINAEGQVGDGMTVRDAVVFPTFRTEDLPSQEDLENAAQEVAANVEAMRNAPLGEAYVGPVLIEGIASPQLFAQLIGSELQPTRRPVSDRGGRQAPSRESQLEGRLGARVLPDWMDVVDDPTQEEWQGKPLFGHYVLDLEGVRPQPLTIVEDGVLQSFLLTRQPIPDQSGSNGRARLPGNYGASTAGFGNLFVNAAETSTEADLRSQLIEMAQQRGRDYGIVIRKLDYPSTASAAEMRQMGGGGRGSQAANLVSRPLLIYRLYPDGREELVRGLEFNDLDSRTLRDIVAAGDQSYRLDYMANTAPLSMVGAASFVSANTVIAPSILLEEAELEPVDDELPTLPVTPPPPLTVSR